MICQIVNCPHCEQLRRERASEAEREARAILAQRLNWLSPKPNAPETKYDSLQAQAEDSRKKQAHICDLLHEHELEHHTAA
jgi:hypothetical protein